MKILKHILLTAAALLCFGSASAQFYSWGPDPASLHWHKLTKSSVDVIYPTTVEKTARRTLFYIENVEPYIGYGFRHSAMNIPFILHPENFRSNGMVMWLPKRVDFLTSPSIDGYSMPWAKQLVAHEYRHAVQYNNLNRGVVRALSYVLGQQSSTVGLLFLPLWLIEGDAVMSETEMSSFGRGLQPSFTIDYRALGNIASLGRNTDKWFCGSYRDNVPDHYHIGYQIASYTYTKYDCNIWDQVAYYSVRNPYLIATTAVSLKKFYKTSVIKLTRETFNDLEKYWSTLPHVEDSSARIPVKAGKSYTTYEHPIWLDDGSILSLKTDLDRPTRLVATDAASGAERRICYTGDISTRPSTDGRRVWWTEYRRSTLFAERVNSTLCYIDLDNGRPRSIRKRRHTLYPTVMDSARLAWVEYDPNGTYSIVEGDGRNEERRTTVEQFTEIHGLAYDNLTRRLYFIATDNSGMWLGRVDSSDCESGAAGRITRLTDGAYITISNLKAADGKLYFGSIASGKDEAHCYDLATGREYRLSESTYGSFSPAPTGRDSIIMTTYDKHGYHLAIQPASKAAKEIKPSRLPVNLVNPPRVKWDVINLDTVNYTPADSTASYAKHRSRRYSKIGHMFKIHSWAPASYNPFEIMEEGQINFNIGATVMSQNLLSNSEMFATYGWNQAEGSFIQGEWRYYGLGVNLGLKASYGGTQKVYTIAQWDPSLNNGEGGYVMPESPKLKKYYSFTTSASLPMMFQSGYHTRYMTVSASWNYSNGYVAKVNNLSYGDGNVSNIRRIGYKKGLHTLQFGLGYQDMVQLAHRDFAPRTGMVLNLLYAINPDNNKFSDLIVAYGKFYLPGLFPHHSLTLAPAYQTSIGGFKRDNTLSFLSYTSSSLLPRGFSTSDISNRNYIATSVNYQLPVWYPEGGIASIIYFKRIRLNVGFDYATFNYSQINMLSGSMRTHRRHLFSYGGDITFDINLFRQPAAATSSITISVYKPSKGPIYIGGGVGLPF